MAKGDKEYTWRREGMIYAYKIVTEGGIEKLKNEIMMRGLWKIDIGMPTEQIDQIHEYLSNNLYQTLISTALFSLREYAGWGKKKLHEYLAVINKNAGNLMDLNWHGQHYMTFMDIATEMNEGFDFDFDLERIKKLDDIENETNPQYRKMDLEETCDFLEREGYQEAAACLKKKVEWLRN